MVRVIVVSSLMRGSVHQKAVIDTSAALLAGGGAGLFVV